MLANLFLHYAFDAWMSREFPAAPFGRHADDVVVHCVSERQAHLVREAIEDRMVEVGLRLHPDKTKIVYCQDANRKRPPDEGTPIEFTFLGNTFRARGGHAGRSAQCRLRRVRHVLSPQTSSSAAPSVPAAGSCTRLRKR